MAFDFSDPLVDSLPRQIRRAYRSAECALLAADNVHVLIVGGQADRVRPQTDDTPQEGRVSSSQVPGQPRRAKSRTTRRRTLANLLPGAVGRLQAFLPEAEEAVRAVEAELAAARNLAPFVAMGQAFTTAHRAALHYGEQVARAIDLAAEPKTIIMVDECGADGAVHWEEGYRQHWLECRVVTVKRGVVRPGPGWQAFCKGFLGRLPGAQTEDLQAHMRLEIAAWTKSQKTKQGENGDSPEAGLGKRWMPAVQAVKLADEAGLSVDLPWITKYAAKHGVETRPRKLPGRHKLEVEWNSLAGYLVNKAAQGLDAAEPTAGERARIEQEKKKASEKKRLDWSSD